MSLETMQIHLNSKEAMYFNGNISDCEWVLPVIEVPQQHQIYCSVQHAIIPYTFYNIDKNNNKLDYISIKLGYSHEVTYPINKGVEFNVSAIDGRSKGIIIDLKSTNYSLINKMAVEIRSFRYPDAYKGKGIFYNKEVVKLKKGKRQG